MLTSKNSIIDATENINEVQDMLQDKTYSGTEVINMIAFLDIIEILQNPMIDSIISNMYYRPFEREPFFKKSTCYKLFEKVTVDTQALITSSQGHLYCLLRTINLEALKSITRAK